MPASLILPDGETSDQAPKVGQAWWTLVALRRAVAAALLVGGMGLVWSGGVWALMGAATLVASGALMTARAGSSAPGPLESTTDAPLHSGSPKPVAGRNADAKAGRSGRQGAEVMVSAVVPVWSRQMEVTREACSDGLAQLLESFAEMSGALDSLTQNLQDHSVTAEPGAVDGAVRNQSPALDKLTAASQRAFEQRDAAVAELGRCQQGMQQLGQLAKRARELSRHTRLVAFNASIEANRNRTEADGGTQAVAAEVRALSTRIAQTAQEMDQVIATMSESIGAAYLKGQVSDTSPEELRLEIDLNAREAMTALLGNMGGALQSGGQVSQAAQLLKDQLDASFIHFQFGDRVSQMLAIVGNDMSNFVQWVGANPSATQNDAAEWLAALESSYTMDEQRSTHHGNVVVDKSSGVDFF